ncbi:unnamed protein product [Brassica oleracea]|uniref:(rape) hypothetical protein n=1 Tax=Brassica napus TaxID=3708 RepID=A0A816QI02_BRANA|nr:unnamed protein product [Brassica napus]
MEIGLSDQGSMRETENKSKSLREKQNKQRDKVKNKSAMRRISTGGRYGGRSVDLPTSLLVRNLSHDCRQEDLRRSFEQFGPLKDMSMPRDYYTG